MTLPDIMEKLKTVSSSAYQAQILREKLKTYHLRITILLFHAIMENGAVFYRLTD